MQLFRGLTISKIIISLFTGIMMFDNKIENVDTLDTHIYKERVRDRHFLFKYFCWWIGYLYLSGNVR